MKTEQGTQRALRTLQTLAGAGCESRQHVLLASARCIFIARITIGSNAIPGAGSGTFAGHGSRSPDAHPVLQETGRG